MMLRNEARYTFYLLPPQKKKKTRQLKTPRPQHLEKHNLEITQYLQSISSYDCALCSMPLKKIKIQHTHPVLCISLRYGTVWCVV